MATTDVAERLTGVASRRGWGLPVASAAISVIAATVLAATHRQIDLGTYLMGGAHALQANLYQVRYPPTGLGFTYPPFAALWFAPVAHIPVRVNQIGFTWLSLASLFGLLAVSLRALVPTLERRVVVWWALALLVPAGLLDPVRETLLLGQVNLLLALVVVADMTLDLPLPRGILVGLAAVKLTPIILIPYLFLTGQSRAGWRALGVFAAAESIAAVVSPRASWLYWTHAIRDPNGAGWLAWIGNQGAIGVVERLVEHSLTTVATLALIATVAGIGLGVAALAYRRSSPILGFLVVEATESLASPVSWSHHFIWIILLIGWLALGADRPAHGERWAAGVAIVFCAAPIWWVHHSGGLKYAGEGWLIPVADSFFLLLAAVVVAAGIRVVRRPSDGRTTDSLAFRTR